MKLPISHKRRRQVNLLPKDQFESSVFGVILSWALSFGKWAVIVTQLIVVGVFLARFGYDRKLTDLRKNIAKQAAIVNSYSEMERDYIITQRSLGYIRPVLVEHKQMLTVIDKLQTLSPSDVWFEKLTITPNLTSIVANAGSLPGFSQLVRKVAEEAAFNSVAINSLQDGVERGARFKFDMSLTYGTEKKQ